MPYAIRNNVIVKYNTDVTTIDIAFLNAQANNPSPVFSKLSFDKEGAPYTLDVKHYANYILPATQDKLGKRIYALLQNRPDKSQAFIDFLIAQPTLKDRASSIALNAFNKEIGRAHV